MLEGSKPFLLEGDSREAVLCLHGFTGSPGIYRKLGRALHKEGLTVYVPYLPGHGTEAIDLLTVTNEQLLAACESAFCMLAEKYLKVHVVGLSLGGTLATLLAAKHAKDKALGCLSLFSPGYAFSQTLAEKLGLNSAVASKERMNQMIPLAQRKPNDDEMDECIFGYDAAPLICFDRLGELNATARSARERVTAPVLLLYAQFDAIVDANEAQKAEGLFPNLFEAHSFSQSEHNLLLGCDRQETISRCSAFISRHRMESVN